MSQVGGGFPNAATLSYGGALQRLADMIVGPSPFVNYSGVAGFTNDQRIVVDGNAATAGAAVMAILAPAQIVAGDTNGDCVVNIDDLLNVIHDWGKTYSPADLDQDGTVNIDDLMIVVSHWTPN